MKPLLLLPTWHPSGVMKDKARAARSFLIHCAKIAHVAAGKPVDPEPTVEVNPSSTRARQVLKRWSAFAFDIEGPSITEPDDIKIRCISACGEEGLVLVWDCRNPKVQLQPLKEAFASPTKTKIVQNGAYDVPIIEANGWPICKEDSSGYPLLWDTMIDDQIRHPDEPTSLSFLASVALDVEGWKHEREGGDLLHYNGLDSAYLYRIWKHEAEDDDYSVRRMELLWKLIIPLTQRGIKVDYELRRRLRLQRNQRIRTWHRRAAKAFKERGLEVPLGSKGGISNKKAQEVLYKVLELPVQRDDKSGNATTGKKALKRLSKLDETGLVDILLERSALKDAEVPLKSRESADGRMRTRFVLGGDEKADENEVGRDAPASGRLASRAIHRGLGTNLQNWKEWVRQILIAGKGNRLIKADYSQIELRLTAYFSKDKNLAKALETDAHLRIMWMLDQETGLYGLQGISWKDILDRYRGGEDPIITARNDCKHNLIYGWTYRMGPKKLESTKGVPYQRGKKAFEGLRLVFPGIVKWWRELDQEVKRRSQATGWGWLKNPWGRRRYFFIEDNDYLPKVCNFMPQSCAADILFDAMVAIMDQEQEEDFWFRLLLTVHDEVVLECGEEQVDLTAALVKRLMERPIPELGNMVVPAEVMVGKNWAKARQGNPNGCKEWQA